MRSDLRSPNIFVCRVVTSVVPRCDELALTLMGWFVTVQLTSRDFTPDSEGVYAKVGDFGLSRVVAGSIAGALATWQWLPPEIIGATNDSSYDEKSDVYSFGMCCWELATRHCTSHSLSLSLSRYCDGDTHDTAAAAAVVVDLFEEYLNDPRFTFLAPDGSLTWNLIEIKQAIINGLRPSAPEPSEKCPPGFYRIMTSCWAANPAERPTFHSIVRRLCKMLEIDHHSFIAQRAALRNKQLLCSAKEPRVHLEVDPTVSTAAHTEVATHVYTFPDLSNKQRVFSLLVVDDRIWAGCGDGSIVSFNASVWHCKQGNRTLSLPIVNLVSINKGLRQPNQVACSHVPSLHAAASSRSRRLEWF